MRSRAVLRESANGGSLDFLRLLPRIAIGVMGSGYIAAALPQEMVGALARFVVRPLRDCCWRPSPARSRRAAR